MADDLTSFADRYFEALAAGDHSALPLAPGVVFTENGQRLPLGKGLWATVTGAAASRAVTVADEEKRQVATWGMVTEGRGGAGTILGVRLRVPDGRVTEIETFAIRPGDMVSVFRDSGFLDAERLAHPSPGLLDLLDQADRPTREELVAAANGYVDGVSGGDASLIPVADDCPRFENGVQTVLRTEGFPPGSEPNPVTMMGVAQQVREGATRHIASARDRGMYLADTSRGLIMIRFFFDHRGSTRGWEGRSPFAGPNSMPAWEIFKVRGGLIRQIEAIIAWWPYGYRWGWEDDR